MSDVDKVISAYSTSQHLCIDLDGAHLSQVEGIAKLIQTEYSEVSNCLIVKSSDAVVVHKRHELYPWLTISETHRESYHLIFDGEMSYEKCMNIITTLAGCDVLNKQYLFVREWRGDMSLRVSRKLTIQRDAPPPQPVKFIRGRQQYSRTHMIDYYLATLSTYNPSALNFILSPVPTNLVKSLLLPPRNPYPEVLPQPQPE